MAYELSYPGYLPQQHATYVPLQVLPMQSTTPQMQMSEVNNSENHPSGDWTFGLCHGCSNSGLCCYAWFCLPCLSNENSHRLDGGGDESCTALFYPGSFLKNRFQAKKTFSIKESTCQSYCTVCCCTHCSEMQIAEELTIRKHSVPAFATI
eukprot:TRINITY_DN8669_c0_g1_i1.p1 TRINITY_DN8669_c0_g1~~TRINITY_DN8669_c0_g1_i1.p1  ORF type:complete len:169 (+),score=28.56 TRINITY_DN8669_c0_g1_i1:57-509(+)